MCIHLNPLLLKCMKSLFLLIFAGSLSQHLSVNCYSNCHLFSGRTMNTSETLLRWEASLCHLEPVPQVYEDIGEHVTGSLGDKFPLTCEPLFPPRTSFATSVMLIHRILPGLSPRLNVIGRYIDCSPVTGLWMYAMDDSGVLQPCASYAGVNINGYTSCRSQCDTYGFVNYIVIGISNQRALPTSDTAVICEIILVWGWALTNIKNG